MGKGALKVSQGLRGVGRGPWQFGVRKVLEGLVSGRTVWKVLRGF
jgi:hypothetical protein